MIRLRLERAIDWWRGFANSRAAIQTRRFMRTIVVIAWRIVRMTAWQFRLAWARMSRRARVTTGIVALVLLSAGTRSIAPSVSETAQGLAVLLLASVGLWMIVTAPFRRRRW